MVFPHVWLRPTRNSWLASRCCSRWLLWPGIHGRRVFQYSIPWPWYASTHSAAASYIMPLLTLIPTPSLPSFLVCQHRMALATSTFQSFTSTTHPFCPPVQAPRACIRALRVGVNLLPDHKRQPGSCIPHDAEPMLRVRKMVQQCSRSCCFISSE